jgi:hypothetical protein
MACGDSRRMLNVIVVDIHEWVSPQKGEPQGCRVARRDVDYQ